MGRSTYYWNQTQLDRAQVAQVLWQAGLRNPGAIAQLIPIAMRESGGRAGVHGSNSPMGNLTGDRGLFQINGTHDRNLIAAGIIRSARDLFDPVTNARAAIYLSNNGDPGRMRQLWGIGPGGWVGSSGSLPAPDWASFNQAQASGLLGRPYTGHAPGQTPTGGYPGGGSGAVPPPTAQNFYDILNAQNLARGQTDAAYTQAQREYAQQMARYEQELLGLNMTSLGYDQQALDVEQAYNESLSRLNSGLTNKQIESNLSTWRELAKNVDALRDLNAQGLANSRDYRDKSQALEKDIYDATTQWIKQQKGFNQQDYRLALQAIQNVVTTEAARWGEVRRLTGAERKNALADFDQRRREAAFREKVQARQAKSDATARGAVSSRGFGDTLREFEGERSLAVSGARNQLSSELEAIQQNFNSGRITYQDAARQAQNARARAGLDYQRNAGALGYQQQQAGQQYRGATLENMQQWRNAYQQYLERNESLRHSRSQGYIDFNDRYNQLQHTLGSQAARDAYNSAMYGINRAGLQVTGRRYGINAQQSQTQLGNTLDNLSYQLASSYFNNPIYTPSPQDLYGTWPGVGGGGGGGTGGGGGGSGYTPSPRPTSPFNRPRDRFTPQPV